MTTSIHQMAIVDPAAKLGAGVKIGPFCTVGPDVVLGDGVELISHVVVAGRTTIGPRTKIYPFLDRPPAAGPEIQGRAFDAGDRRRLRDPRRCDVDPGTEGGGMKTVIGDRGLFLAIRMSAMTA